MLKLDWCDFEAANYACKNWHYSKCMPAGKTIKIGVWEQSKFIGAVIFGRGANNNQAKSFNLKVTEICELCRVALTKHSTPVSRILSIAIKLLRKNFKEIKLIFSYADETNQGHKGGIYKADNWEYLGLRISKGSAYYIINNKKIHGRSVRAKYGKEKNIPFAWEYAPPPEETFIYKRFSRHYFKSKRISNPGEGRRSITDRGAPRFRGA